MSNFPKASVARVMKSNSSKRVSGEALSIFTEALEDYGMNLSMKAASYADHAGRKTIKADDVKLALKY